MDVYVSRGEASTHASTTTVTGGRRSVVVGLYGIYFIRYIFLIILIFIVVDVC